MANVIALAYLVNALLATHPVQGKALVIATVPIWLTNIIVFALWY